MALLLAMPGLGSAVTVVDDAGYPVTLATPARRVISLSPHATELLSESGAFDELVAVSAYSNFPAAAQKLPVIGTAHGLNLEQIARLHPDLVVAWTSGNSASQVEALEHLGIAVFRSDPKNFEQIASSLERLGALTGNDALAREHARLFREEIARLERRYSARAPVRVFYQVWDQPLMTVGGTHLISNVIRLCGGRNVFDGLSGVAPMVDREAVIAADPEVIVRSNDSTDAAAGFASWRAWTQVSAVRSNQLVIIPADYITRATTRVVLGAQELCEALDKARH